MADGYGINKLEDYIDSIRDGGVTFEIQNLSKEVQEVVRDLTKIIDQNVKGDVPTQKELKELQQKFYAYLQSSQTTTKETRNYVATMFSQLFLRIDKLDKNRLTHSFNANLSNMIKSGVLNVDKKGAESNVLAQLFKAGYISPVTKSVETFQDKLMTFLNIEKAQEKTKRRQFTEDLVEGLARSKFFGGALTDFIRLGTFFVASWLKDKGTWGKVLAVALVAAGPIIGTAIASFISKAFIGILGKLGGLLLKAAFAPIRWLGSKLFSWMGKLLSAILMSRAFGRIFGPIGLGARAKGAGTALNAGMALAPGWGGNVVAFGGPMAQAAPKAANSGFLKTLTSTVGRIAPWVARIGGFMGQILPWILRLGKLFNVVGWIWLGIEAIAAIVKWWKGRKGKDKDEKAKSSDTDLDIDSLGVSDVPSQSNGVRSGSQQSSTNDATLANHQITSGFGKRIHPVYGTESFHSGIDLKYKQGEAVNAFMGGTVVSSQWQDGFGNTVRVRDKNGRIHVYGHLSSLGVQAGQEVKRGQYLGAAGSTGTSTGSHLHYGVATDLSWNKSSYVNPIDYLAANEPDALKASKKGRNKKQTIDKFSQNVIDYWDSHGKDKGGIRLTATGITHSKSNDYAKLAERFKREYAEKKHNELYDKSNLSSQLRHDEKIAIAMASQEAKDYANKKIAEYVASKKSEKAQLETVNASSQSIKVSPVKGDLPVTTKTAAQQAQEQWNNINRDFLKDKTEESNKNNQTVILPENQPMMDFSGTETFSKVLQSAISIQQQTFQQR